MYYSRPKCRLVLVLVLAMSGWLRCEAQLSFVPVAVGVIGSAILAGMGHINCHFQECCLAKSSWIEPNITKLQDSLQRRLHGQHLVQDVVVRALLSHYADPEPSKAMVISLHGNTGTGKNFVSDLIAEALFKKGTKSKYVLKVIASVHYPHDSKTDLYKLDLIDKVRAQVKECERSLFIFDEVHKLPIGLIDVIKPFIDFHQDINGIDYRKSVFLFLSNTGTREISNFALDWWQSGKTRADITLQDVEGLVRAGAFNERGGLHMSELIEHSLVDFYVPFLPMERRHIEMCARDDLLKRKKQEDAFIIRQVGEEMTYYPPSTPLFATMGCKNVHKKVGYMLTNFDRF